MKTTTLVLAGALVLAAVPAAAQFGQIGKVLRQAQQVHQEFTFTDAEEEQLGSDISARLRDKYGVVQDRAVHRYVTLVGSVLAQASSRPTLKWTFIVLDTDAVNAFAAPGGFVHITRGALALLQNEAELADVLAHEISHVTAKHTLRSIQKSKGIEAIAQSSRSEFLSQVGQRAYDAVVQNSFDRGDEMEADRLGVTLADSVGYAPTGLGAFLERLADRNRGLTDRSGMFASHPETKIRLDGLAKTIASNNLNAAALVAARYHAAIAYTPVPVDRLGQTPPASASTASSGGGGSGWEVSRPSGRRSRATRRSRRPDRAGSIRTATRRGDPTSRWSS